MFFFVACFSFCLKLLWPLLLTLVCLRASSITMTVTMAPTGGLTMLGQHDMVLHLQLILSDTMRHYVGLITLSQQQPQSQIPSQACANYAMGPSQVSFSFRVETPTNAYAVCWCLLWCLLFAFRFQWGCNVHQWGLKHWAWHHWSPLEYILGRHMYLLVMVCDPCQECTKWLCLPLLWLGGASCYSFSFPSAISFLWWEIQLGNSAESHPIPLPSLHGGEVPSLPGFIPPDDMYDSKDMVN